MKPHMISLHALNGSEGHNTMRISTHVNQVEVIILVDSGSTHNFIDANVVKRLNLPVELTPTLKLTIANGVTLCT